MFAGNHDERKKEYCLDPCSSKERCRWANFKFCPIVHKAAAKKRRKDKKRTRKVISYWDSSLAGTAKVFRWSLRRRKNEKQKKVPCKELVRKTIQSQRPDPKSDFVLGPAPGWPNVQTLWLKPRPVSGTTNQKTVTSKGPSNTIEQHPQVLNERASNSQRTSALQTADFSPPHQTERHQNVRFRHLRTEKKKRSMIIISCSDQ